MSALRLLMFGSVLLLAGTARAAKPTLLMLQAKGATGVDAQGLSGAVAVYTRDLGLTVHSVPTPFPGATIAGIRQAAALVRRRNARLAFWCEPRTPRAFVLYTVNGNGDAARRVVAGTQKGRAELYRAIGLKLRALLAAPGAVAEAAANAAAANVTDAEPSEEVAQPPASVADPKPVWRAAPAAAPVAPPPSSPPAASSLASPPGSPAPVVAQSPPATQPDSVRPRIADNVSPPPVPDIAPPSPPSPPAPPAVLVRPAAEDGGVSARPAAPAATGARRRLGRFSAAVGYRVAAGGALAPLRQAVDLECGLRLSRTIELDAGLEIAPVTRSDTLDGTIILVDVPLRVGARVVREVASVGLAAGPYLAAHYLRASATGTDNATDERVSAAAGLGVEALARMPLFGPIGMELGVFAELLVPSTRFWVGQTAALAAGARAGLVLGFVLPFQ